MTIANLTDGAEVTLVGARVYSTATSPTASATKSGIYYIWNATTANGRIRITNSVASVGMSGQDCGWVNVSDIALAANSSPDFRG